MNVSDLAKILGIDKKGDQKITFKRGNFTPEKIGVTPVFNRMFYNANFKQEITRINNDIKSAFKNLIKMGVHKNEIPLVSASLFNQLMVTIDRGNLSFIKNDSAPEFTRKELKKISDIQYKIYKVLFKIEEDLIDEQDTSIKGNEKSNKELLANMKKLLDERDKKLREEMMKEFQSQMAEFMETNGGGGGSGFGFPMPSITDILSWYAGLKGAQYGFKGAKWLWNKFRQSRIVSKVKTLDEKLKQADKKAQEAKEKADKAKEKADKAKEKADKAKTEADKKAQKEAEKAQKEAEKAQKQAEKEFKQTQEDLEKANAESEKARAKAEQLGAKDKLPPKPEIKTGGTPAPRPTPPSNAAKKFPKLAKLFEKFKKALKAAGPALAKATVVLDIFILLPMKICEFWDLSMRPGKEGHLEFNFLERSIYCLTAGLTQWIEDHANIFVDIAGLVHLIIEFMANNFAEMAKDGSGTFEALANILGFLSWGVGKLIEKCIAPATKEIVNWIKKQVGAETGDRCGMIAVGIMRDSWEDLKSTIKGCVPNKETFALITGSNPVFNELERRGIYKFNAFGESELKYNTVHDIANKMTKAEIQAVLAHDDVDSSIKKNLKEALNYKIEQGISDRDVYKNSYVDGYLDSLITVLNNCDGRMEEQWLRMLQGSVDQSREFLLRFGWISLEYDTSDEFKVLWKGPFKDDEEAEGMFKYIFSRYKGQHKFLRVWQNQSYDVLYFDVYGTVMSAGFTTVPYKDVLNPTTSKKHLKVLGYIDKQREFHEGLSCPNDEIFEAVKKQDKQIHIYSNNIIVQEPVQSVTEKMAKSDIEGVTGGGLPAHLAMTTGYSEPIAESYTEQDFNSDVGSGSSGSSGSGYSGGLPSHLSGTYNPNLVTETFNFSGSESVPDLTTPGYTGTDYTSIEAIKKARVFQRSDGKWYSDNPFVDAIIQIESRRDATARPWSRKEQRYLSSAAGLFQFIESTGETFGLHSLQDRMNPYKSLEAFKRYVLFNMNKLKKNGIPVTPANLYLSHQQGDAGFDQIYKYITGKTSSLSSKIQRLMAGNTHGHRYTTAQDWYRNWVNDIAKLMGQSAKMPPMAASPENIQSNSGGNSSPGDYSGSSGSYGSYGYSGSSGSVLGQKAPDGVPSYVKNSYSAGSSSPSNFGSSGSSGSSGSYGYSGSSGSVLGQKAPEGVPSYVKDSYDLMQKNTGNSMAIAAQYATKHAKKQSIGYCAKYVANALEAAGLKFQRQPSAYLYHRNGILSKAGFGLVSKGMQGYTPEIGDVCVVDRFNSHVHGHICIWNGKNWVSDFVQRTPNVYKDGPGPMYFYRYGGPDLVPNDSMLNEPYTDESYPSTNSDSYSDPGMQSPETMNANAPKTPGVQSSGSSEKEGEAEGLFSIKISDILG